MPAVFKWAHRVEYKSVNINSLWTDGIAQKAHFSYPHTTAFEVVRKRVSILYFCHRYLACISKGSSPETVNCDEAQLRNNWIPKTSKGTSLLLILHSELIREGTKRKTDNPCWNHIDKTQHFHHIHLYNYIMCGLRTFYEQYLSVTFAYSCYQIWWQTIKSCFAFFATYFSHKGDIFCPRYQRRRSDVHAHQELQHGRHWQLWLWWLQNWTDRYIYH